MDAAAYTSTKTSEWKLHVLLILVCLLRDSHDLDPLLLLLHVSLLLLQSECTKRKLLVRDSARVVTSVFLAACLGCHGLFPTAKLLVLAVDTTRLSAGNSRCNRLRRCLLTRLLELERHTLLVAISHAK